MEFSLKWPYWPKSEVKQTFCLLTLCAHLFKLRGGGDRYHLRVVPPGQHHRRPRTPKRFCLSAIFEPGFIYFFVVKFFSHVFFMFAFRWFRVFHRGCYVYFPIVFSSNSLCILYIFIFIYFIIYFFIAQWVF